MKLSSLDIRKQEFSRSLRGFDPDEVDAFLNLVSGQWQELVDELRRAEERVREQELKLEHYMKVEEALEEALKTARTSSRQTLENAEKRAAAIIREAEDRAVAMTREAEEERHRIRRDTTGFRVRQQEIVAKMRSFLMSEMELLSHFDREEADREPALQAAEVRTIASRTTAPPRQEPELEPEPEPELDPEPAFEAEEEAAAEVDSVAETPFEEPAIEDEDPEPPASRFELDVDEEDDLDDRAPAWKVHDVVARTGGEDAGDEIKKIRRILDAMDDESDA